MQRFDLIVRGGMAVLADEVKRLDIGIIGGRIAELSERIDGESDRLIDASQLHIMPGMIDVHVHFNEPGLGEWEGFYHGSSSMAAGGCTTYFDMPLNGVPPTIRISALQQKLEAAKGQSFVDYALWGGLVPRNRDDLAALAQSGIIGFKAFMSSPSPSEEDEFREADDLTLYEGMQEIAKQHKILALHAESEAITGRLAERCKRLGLHSAADYIASRPVIAEMEAVQRALFFAEQTGCALHFVHISSARSVELIDAAKQRGIDVTL
ncbi:amidohydrolase family protein, partial [Paenibacillus sepulcri]|nr:amidohydrolase family protein [Paenibacillus sepulcri]